jgi:hypothetical protein
MMHRTEKLMQDLARDGWDFSDPAVRAIFDRAHQIVSRRTIDQGEPGPDAAPRGGARGVSESYPGLLVAGSRDEYFAHSTEMQRLGVWDREQDQAAEDVAKRVAIFRQVGIARGYGKPTGVHDTRRFSFVENYRPQLMESYTESGERKLMPVYGNGQGQDVGGSKYAHLASADADAPYILGGGTTEEESKFRDVPEPPRLADGSIDYDRLNELNGHGPMRGRKNISIPRG